MKARDPSTPLCAFCGKAQNEVKQLVAGPTIFICNECVALCRDIIAELSPETEGAQSVPKPKSPDGNQLSLLASRLHGATGQLTVLRERLPPGVSAKILEQIDSAIEELRAISTHMRQELRDLTKG